VLACGSGRTDARVAQELRVSMPIVGKWRARFVARRLDGLLDEPRSGVIAHDRRRAGGSGDRQNLGNEAPARHALEHPRHGESHGPEPDGDLAHLASVQLAAPPNGDVQAADRSAVYRKSPRRRRPVHEPARPGRRLVRRRKESSSGLGPEPTDGSRPSRTADARLCSPGGRRRCLRRSTSPRER